MVDPVLLAQVKQLSDAELLELIRAARDADEVPDDMSAEEAAEIHAALQDLREHPEDEVPWETVDAELRRRLG